MNAYEWVALILAILVILGFIVGSIFIYLYTDTTWWTLLIYGVCFFFLALAIILLTVANANIAGTFGSWVNEAKAYFTKPRATGVGAQQE